MEEVAIERSVVNRTEEAEEFASFFEDAYPRLVRLLWALTTDLSEAEDLVQETMVRMCERWGDVRQTASPSAYAYRTAINLNRSRLRRSIGYLRRLSMLAVSSPDDEGADERADVSI